MVLKAFALRHMKANDSHRRHLRQRGHLGQGHKEPTSQDQGQDDEGRRWQGHNHDGRGEGQGRG